MVARAEGTGGEVGRCWSGDVEFQVCEAKNIPELCRHLSCSCIASIFPILSWPLSLTLQTEVSREVRSQALTGSVGTSGFC